MTVMAMKFPMWTTSAPARRYGTAATWCVSRDVAVPAPADVVFEYLDTHERLAAHMEKRSWQLGFGRLALVSSSVRDGRQILEWRGRVFGLPIDAVEVLLERTPPTTKRWRSLGTPRLWVLGPYAMGLHVVPRGDGAFVRIELEYALPDRGLPWVLGRLLGHAYAQWCVERMIDDVRAAFIAGR